MKKHSRKINRKKTRAPLPRKEKEQRIDVVDNEKPRLIRRVAGFEELPDGRNIYYRKTIFDTGVIVTYGPKPATQPPKLGDSKNKAKKVPPHLLLKRIEELREYDEAAAQELTVCRLVKNQNKEGAVKWTFNGPDFTLFRGEMAKGALQGRWDDPASMAIVRACERVRADLSAWDGLDGKMLCTLLLHLILTRGKRIESEPVMRNGQPLMENGHPVLRERIVDDGSMATLRAAILAEGLVQSGDSPRPYRIACAVRDAAMTYSRPPSAMEVFRQFEASEKSEGRQISSDARNFYRDLSAAGWGWLSS